MRDGRACAVALVAAGNATGAARIVGDALASAPPGNAGWRIPIEPLLHVPHDRAAWTRVLAALSARAVLGNPRPGTTIARSGCRGRW